MNKVISLMGPTATGKTDLAILLANKFNIEIISVDSVMFYKEFNIGSAKPDKSILLQNPHRMVNILEPYERYSVAKFYNDLLMQINSIHAVNKIPLLVGGSMMYFKTFFSGGLSNLQAVSEDIKKQVSDMLLNHNLDYLYKYLLKIDQISAKKIHPNDQYRIVRMIEIFLSNNKKPSDILKKSFRNARDFDYLNLSIIPDNRKYVHQRIENRLDNMLKDGLLDEVSKLKTMYSGLNLPAMSTIGYKQADEYLKNIISLDIMKSSILAATRQLAKRQITWLRHLDATTVYTFTDYDNIKSRLDIFLDRAQ